MIGVRSIGASPYVAILGALRRGFRPLLCVGAPRGRSGKDGSLNSLVTAGGAMVSENLARIRLADLAGR